MGAGGPLQWLRAGRVGRPHGLDGSFLVAEPNPSLLAADGEVEVGGERRQIVRRAGYEARMILRLQGIEDRDAAARLRGAELLVARAAAPALEEDEWWAQDLEGCLVRDGERQVGVVERLLGLPSCEVLDVRRPDAENLLVPLIADAVRAVDIEQREIDVDLTFLGEA